MELVWKPPRNSGDTQTLKRTMRVKLEYGTAGVEIAMPGDNVTVLAPRFVPGLPDEEAAFLDAVRRPVGSAPLASLIQPNERVAIVIADVTRPLPRLPTLT